MYLYLLRSMKVTRPCEVYAADIYVHPHAKGLLYLAIIIDRHNRKPLAKAALHVNPRKRLSGLWGTISPFQVSPPNEDLHPAYPGIIPEDTYIPLWNAFHQTPYRYLWNRKNCTQNYLWQR